MNSNEKKAADGSDTRILLTGVFGPFAQDDAYGSRAVNPMELYHNQVTKAQGPFSLRMFHRTFGLLMIEANIDAPCTILEFPTLERFIEEIKNNSYDVIGISSIIPNIGKVKKMCDVIRAWMPGATIVVGGHIANRDDLNEVVDTDYICRGDGIRWFRNFLGQNEDAPIKHPAIISGFGTRIMGMQVTGGNTAATLIPSVGCPMGCNFCSTSALFGGKGHSINFYKTGDELFSVLCQLEEKLRVNSFFVLDENFLLYKERALRLLALMEEHDKSWGFYVFSSARVLESYTMEQLIGLGISWIWMGIEGENSQYAKLKGVDTFSLVKKYQSHGIRVLGSTIIGMEDHTPENIESVIDYAVSHNTDFHQFMLYTPLPGTPLYAQYREMNLLLTEEECPAADIHGQERFNFRHAHITDNREKEYLLTAFRKDFEINGPSLFSIARTTMNGWKRYRNHPDPRVARRFKNDIAGFSTVYAGALWAMIRWYKDDSAMSGKLTSLLNEMYRAFKLKSRIAAPVLGSIILPLLKREAKKLAGGWTYEPPVIYEMNRRARELRAGKRGVSRIRIPEIRLPAYDLSRVLNSCHEQMNEVYNQIVEFRDRAGVQLHAGLMAGGKDHALEQIRTIRRQIAEMSETAQVRFNEVSRNMSDMYRQSREQMEGVRAAMAEKVWNIQRQIEDSCRHLEEVVESKILPEKQNI